MPGPIVKPGPVVSRDQPTITPDTILTPGQIYTLAREAGFNQNQATIMVAIALAESGGKVGATHTNTNGTTDYGVWQINSIHNFDPHQLTTNPLYNARAAFSVWKSQGYGGWTTYKSGDFKKFLQTARGAASGPVAPIGNLVDATAQKARDVGDFINAFGQFINFLSTKENWTRRLLPAVIGGILILIALNRMLDVTAIGQTAKGVAKSAATTGAKVAIAAA